MKSESDHIKRAWDLMETIGFCLLVTRKGEGFHGRPMTALVKTGERRIYFLSNRSSESAEEIASEFKVYLGFSDASSKYVSLYGKAKVLDDRSLVQKLWNTGAQAYFPEGPDSPDVIAICVEPEIAEYWDGPSGPIGMVKIAFAAATGQVPDMGENAKMAI
jgi:general stress protein 26